MENDVLRSGAIFKLTNKDLERVRSPPLVKFNIPKERSSEKPAPKDQVRETFLEIYRQTPVPQMAGNRRMSTLTTSNIHATDSLNKSYKADYSSVISSEQKKNDRMINSTINSYQEKVQEDNVDYGDNYEQDDDEVVVEKVEPIIFKVPSGRTSQVNKNESMDVSSKTQVTQAETSTIPNTSIVTKNHIAADVPQPSGTFRSGSANRGSSSTGSSGSNTASRSRAGGRSSNQTGDSLLLLFGSKSTTSTTTTTVSIRNNKQTSRMEVSNSTTQPKSSPSSMNTAPVAPASVVASISATPNVEPSVNSKQEQKARKENTASKPHTLPTHDLLQNYRKKLSTDEVSAMEIKESLLVKRARSKPIKDNLETSQPNKQKKRLNKKEKITTTDSDSSEIILTDSGVSKEVVSDTAESGPESILFKHNKHSKATRKSFASSTDVQKPRRGRPVGKLTKNKITPGTKNITQESKEMTEKIHNTSGSGDSEGNSDHSSIDAGIADKNDPGEVHSSTDEAATVTRSGRQSIPRKVIPLLSETERETKATERATQKVSTKRGRPSKTTVETTATRSVKPKSKSSSSTDNVINHHAYNLHTAIREVADSSGWTPAQKVALYSVQSRIDVHASDFWEQVSDALGELGIEKTSTECSVKWFEKVEDARIRKEKKAAEDREKARKKAEVASNVTTNSTKESVDNTKEIALAGVKAIEEPVKAKRIGKAQLKRLAGEAMKATHEDDIFESTGMQSNSYWTDSAAITTAVTMGQDVLSQEMLLDLSGADNELIIAKNSNNSSSGGHAGERAKLSEQEEMDFATSHVHKLNYRRPLAYNRTKPTVVNDKSDVYTTKQSKKTTTTAVARVEKEYHTLQKQQHQQQQDEEENLSDDEELHSEDEEEDS